MSRVAADFVIIYCISHSYYAEEPRVAEDKTNQQSIGIHGKEPPDPQNDAVRLRAASLRPEPQRFILGSRSLTMLWADGRGTKKSST